MSAKDTYHVTIMWGTNRFNSYGSNKDYADLASAQLAYDEAVKDSYNTYVKLERTRYEHEIIHEVKR